MVYADKRGRIFDHPHLRMVCRRGHDFMQPKPEELIALPDECELFLLPGRRAMGWHGDHGRLELLEQNAVAAFVSPGHTLNAVCAYKSDPGSPVLPLFAYGAVGFAHGRFWVCAKQVDVDPRQQFVGIAPEKIRSGARQWLKTFPGNRLVRHLMNCALVSGCPAARNLALGRFEAPLPTSRVCNARCLGCLSWQPKDSGFPPTQKRIGFRPQALEIIEVMQRHGRREQRPVYSFGQGCEGEPLTEASLIAEAVRGFRQAAGRGTVNVNTNGSLPGAMPQLTAAGVSSVRVSLNSAQADVYQRYYRPQGYGFADVQESIQQAKRSGLFVSLNLLFFPGVNDSEEEIKTLIDMVQKEKIDFIQLRNMNLDPELYLRLFSAGLGCASGLEALLRRLREAAPWIRFGYFNPYLGG
jgi:pyruvate-formate lyase-activating enzyme